MDIRDIKIKEHSSVEKAEEIQNLRSDLDSGYRGRTSIVEEAAIFELPKMLIYWQAVSRWALIILAGLAPIFFLPFTNLPVAVHKEILVFIFVLVAFFALLGRILIEGKIRYPGHLLTLALAVLVLVWGASTFFSINPLSSLIGNWSAPDSFVSIVLFSLLAFLIVMTFDRRDIIFSLLVFLASLAVLGSFELLQLAKVFVLPFAWSQNAAFNPVGSVNDLGILLAFGLIIASGIFSSSDISKSLKWLLGFGVLIFLINLVVIDFWAIWVGLILAMVFLISFLSIGLSTSNVQSRSVVPGIGSLYPGIRSRDASSHYQGLQLAYFRKAWLPSIILLIAIMFLIFSSPLTKFIQTPIEVSPNLRSTLDIGLANLKAGHFFLGSGPNTFGSIYNLYKPSAINQTIFWATTFNAGSSAVTTWFGTNGILGILALLFLIVAFILTGVRGTSIRSSSRGVMNIASQAVFVAVLFLFAMWFLYAANFTNLTFAFWGIGLFLAASLSSISEISGFTKSKSPDFVNHSTKTVFKEIQIFTSPPKIFIFSLLIVGLMVGAVVAIYFETNRYVAEIYFSRGSAISTSKAISFWPYDERYFQSLAQAVFLELNDLLAKKDLPQEEIRAQFQNITTDAVAAARQARDLNPTNPFNNVLMGNIYENLVPFVADASGFALSSYSAAVSLDPKNPANFLALARVEVAKNELDKAVSNLEKAIELKNDYAPARYLLVQVFDKQGKLTDAVKRAEELVMLNNTDVGALFQLGFLYYKNSQFDFAKQVFERVAQLSPNYSNARYFLGLIYDKDNPKDKTAAIEQFLKIAELNPDNDEIKLIIANLEAGKSALYKIVPPAQAPQSRAEAPVSEGTKAPVQKLKK